ncbi:MAG: phage head morphogenesis protein [Burkholderiaceae bacterium]
MKRIRPWLYPSAAERAYMGVLLRLSRQCQRTALSRLAASGLLLKRPDGRTDDFADTISEFILEVFAALLKPGQEAVFRLRDAFTQVVQFNDRQWRLQVQAGTGVDIGPSGALPPGARMALGNKYDPHAVRAVFGVGVDVYRSEPWLADLQKQWTAENVRLIKSIPDAYMGDVERIIRNGVMAGQSNATIVRQLRDAAGVSERKAKLIAADQIGKANAALTMYRQMDLGVDRYKWMSSHDSRVRPSHRAADGNVYDWKTPPAVTGGHHPGTAIRCRCWAKPILTDLDAAERNPRLPQGEAE